MKRQLCWRGKVPLPCYGGKRRKGYTSRRWLTGIDPPPLNEKEGTPDHKILINQFWRTQDQPSRGSTHDSEDTRFQWETVHSPLGYRGTNFVDYSQYAREAGFKGRPASIQISGVGSESKNRLQIRYRVLLRKIDGSFAGFRSYRVDKITEDAMSINLSEAKNAFSAVAQDLFICSLEWMILMMLLKNRKEERTSYYIDPSLALSLWCAETPSAQTCHAQTTQCRQNLRRY